MRKHKSISNRACKIEASNFILQVGPQQIGAQIEAQLQPGLEISPYSLWDLVVSHGRLPSRLRSPARRRHPAASACSPIAVARHTILSLFFLLHRSLFATKALTIKKNLPVHGGVLGTPVPCSQAPWLATWLGKAATSLVCAMRMRIGEGEVGD